MNTWFEVSPSIMEWIDWTTRATVLFGAGTILCLLMHKRSAAVRHSIWTAALLGALVLPAVKWMVPGWDLPSSKLVVHNGSASEWLAVHQNDVASNSVDLAADTSAVAPIPSIDDTGSAPNTQPISLPSESAGASVSMQSVLGILPVIYGLGVGIMLSGVVVGTVSLRRLRRTAKPFSPVMQSELDCLSARLGVRRRVAGLTSSVRSIPMTWGAWNPVVLLPDEAVNWSEERRQMVLLHELAHVRRCDVVSQMIGSISRALHWFNPLAWWALSRLRFEQERACDDCVLNTGASPADYATELVTVTARRHERCWDTAVALAMNRFANIESRLISILDSNRDRRPMTSYKAICLCGCLSLILSLIAIPRWPAAIAADQASDAQADAKGAAPAKAAEDDPKKSTDSNKESSGGTLATVRSLIEKHAANEIDNKRLTVGAIRGMLESLEDPHSGLIPAEEFREFTIHVEGRVVGIGAQLALDGDQITIVTPMPGSPAAKSGLRPRDIIVAVDGNKVSDLKKAVDAIRGPQGSEVKIRIRRDGNENDVTVRRDVVPLSSIRGLHLDSEGKWQYWIDPETKLAYVQITDFNQRTAEDAERVLGELKNGGMKGLIIDLRGCPGGLLEASVKTVGLFVGQGTVATIRGRQEPEHKIEVKAEAGGNAKFGDLPLMVMIDDQTASAAEVVAGALQDHQRAIIVGERSLGKGSVQSLIQLEDLGANLKITTAQLHRMNGAMLHRAPKATTWGVDPNDGYFVALTAEQRAAFREKRKQRELMGVVKITAPLNTAHIKSELADPGLAAAVQSLATKIKTGEFEKTGRPLSEMQAAITQRDTLIKERDQLLQKLKLIEKQL